jgi:ferritin
MLENKLQKALSDQVNSEYYSAYLYLAMSSSADQMGLKGAAHWFFCQAKEELAHGTRIFQYIQERGAVPILAAIDLPPRDYKNIEEIFKATLAHEIAVSEKINAIATIAMQEADHACYQFISWFVNEQVEEETSVKGILDKLALVEGSRGMLLSIDNELGARVFVNPFPQFL